MKKFLFILGILAMQGVLAGTLFKIMHWPGANILMVLGCLLISLVFLPTALFYSYQEQKRYLWLHLVTAFVFSMGILSILFKVMHWTGAQVLLHISFPLPFLLFLPVFLYHTRRDKKFNDTYYVGVLFGLTFVAVFGVLLSL